MPDQVAAEGKMTVDVEEYVSSFRTDLCDVMAAWSRGSKFAELMKMTDVFEVSCHSMDRACTIATIVPMLVEWASGRVPLRSDL